ncbi:hypothetical protein BJ546DRAFT_253505 [Cryomyces antarcticus]
MPLVSMVFLVSLAATTTITIVLIRVLDIARLDLAAALALEDSRNVSEAVIEVIDVSQDLRDLVVVEVDDERVSAARMRRRVVHGHALAPGDVEVVLPAESVRDRFPLVATVVQVDDARDERWVPGFAAGGGADGAGEAGGLGGTGAAAEEGGEGQADWHVGSCWVLLVLLLVLRVRFIVGLNRLLGLFDN